MGKTMDKDKVIYGQTKELAPKDVKWAEVEKAVQAKVGEETITGLAKAKLAVAEAMANKKLKNPYVKVGAIGNDLILRIKDKGLLKDTELDTVLMTGFKDKADKFAKTATESKTAPTETNESETESTETKPTGKIDNSVEAIVKAAEEHLELRKKVIPIMNSLLKEFTQELSAAGTSLDNAKKQLAMAKSNKAEKNADGVEQAIHSAGLFADELKEIRKNVQGRYDQVMKKPSGDVLTARNDFGKREQLPLEMKKDYLVESGKLFGQGDLIARQINVAVKQVTKLVAEVDLVVEDAQTYSSRGRPPAEFIPRLTTIKEDAAKQALDINTKAQKVERLPENMKKYQDNGSLDRAAKLKSLDQNKSVVDALELDVQERVEQVETFKKRMELLPEDAKENGAIQALLKAAKESVSAFDRDLLIYRGHIKKIREYDQTARSVLG